MKTKISHKLVAVNISIIFALTATFISFSYFSSDSLFSNALNGIDTEVMKELSPTLSDYYRDHQSWAGYVENKSLWEETVNRSFFSTFFRLMAKTKAMQTAAKAQVGTTSTNQPPTLSNEAFNLPFGTFLQRATLLDRDKNILIKPEMHRDNVSYRPIKLDNKIIGWLGVGDINVDMLPLAEYFFKQQLSIGTWAAVIGCIIATLLSFFFSSRITAPIKKLTFGAKEIAKRNFRNTVEITTTDELAELAASFNLISKELEGYEIRQKQWLMDVSHEIRTPITILKGEIAAIRDNLVSFDNSALASLQDEISQITRLVDDLSELSTLDSLNFSMDKQRIDLGQLLSSYSQRYHEKLNDVGIELHLDIPEHPIFAYGDATRLSQVLKNIFENSLRHTTKPGELWVSLKHNKAVLKLSIEDSGPGVPSDSLIKIFDRLYRTDRSRSRKTGGIGLGLTITKRIIEAHSGTIAASHSARGGLCISMQLPASLGLEK